MIHKIEYDVVGNKIVLPSGAPFDGKEYLIRFASGWCEAWWNGDIITSTVPDSYGEVLSGWTWICMDDDFQKELDEALNWAEKPKFDENDCPGHIASVHDSKTCGLCDTHIDSLRPDEPDSDDYTEGKAHP